MTNVEPGDSVRHKETGEILIYTKPFAPEQSAGLFLGEIPTDDINHSDLKVCQVKDYDLHEKQVKPFYKEVYGAGPTV